VSRSFAIPSELEHLVGVLSGPLSPQDLADGWSEDSRARALQVAQRSVEELHAGKVPDAAHHFLRWLDHDGIAAGALLDAVAAAQSAIRRSTGSAK
jgi:hypothetical protein